MPRYKLEDLNIFATPKAERMMHYKGISWVEFEFPEIVRTALSISCNLVRASLRDGVDHYEAVIRLYEGENPQRTNEKHIGKLYIRIYGTEENPRFETFWEKFEWHDDGSFDIINQKGEVFHRTDSESEATELEAITEVLTSLNQRSSTFMNLERLAQICGLVAFISFIIAIVQLTKSMSAETLLVFFLTFSVIGVLSSILVALKQIARDLESK